MSTPAFTKTIRFKLTLWYTAFLILLGILLIVGINLAMARFGAGISPWQFEGTQSPREIAELVRSENLKLLRNYSLVCLGGVILLGAVGGYFLSGMMLKPVDRVSSLAA